MAAVRKPTFFLVGAPKCGTTAMHEYLRRHPDIFMPQRKDTNHFATDLVPAGDPWLDPDKFLSLFHTAGREEIVGESSVFHLYSRVAAAGIHAFCPRARIVVMLRNPIDFLPSYHSQLLYTENETIRDFPSALRAEGRRKLGHDLPATVRFVEMLFYSEVCRFSVQLERYLRAFGRDAVHCILFDDLKHDTASTCRELLRFLGVDEDFRAPFPVVNPNKQIRSAVLNRIIWRPPRAVAAARLVFPKAIRSRLLPLLKRANTVYAARRPLPAEFRAELCESFRGEVDRLQDLLQVDLSHWIDPDRQSRAEPGAGRGLAGVVGRKRTR